MGLNRMDFKTRIPANIFFGDCKYGESRKLALRFNEPNEYMPATNEELKKLVAEWTHQCSCANMTFSPEGGWDIEFKSVNAYKPTAEDLIEYPDGRIPYTTGISIYFKMPGEDIKVENNKGQLVFNPKLPVIYVEVYGCIVT